jgi:flagellar biosynthesis/type III secretory pathway chaperone
MRDVNFEKLTKRAIAIYTQERAALVDGDTDALNKAKQLKAALLEDLVAAEDAIAAAPTTTVSLENRAQLTSLHAIIARRTSENCQLAKANQHDSRSTWSGR